MVIKVLRVVPPFIAAALLTGGAASQEDPIWTVKPTRIDRSRQHYERLPALKAERDSRTWLIVPERIKVIDSTSFAVGQQVYQIANLKPVKSKRICKAVDGGRWACGRMASIFLGNLVRGKRLLCDIEQTGKKLLLDHCVIGTRDVAQTIIANGYGAAGEDATLRAVQDEAQKTRRKGLWRNPECVENFEGC